MSSDDEHEPIPTPEEDLALAEEALAEGDLRHAAFHTASALAADPESGACLRKLDQIIEAADDPLSLFPLEEETPFTVVAGRAYVLARRSEHQEALELLLQILHVRHDVPYLAWALDWVRRREVVEKLEPDGLCAGLGGWLQHFVGGQVQDESQKRAMERVAMLLERVRVSRPEHDGLLFFHAVTLRKLDRHEEALKVAEEGYERNPSWQTATSIAITQREMGLTDAALASYERALGHNPDDLSCRLDLGDLLLESGRLDEAAAWYGQVLSREPGHPWAQPSMFLVEWQRSREDRWLERIADSARQGNQRALRLMLELQRRHGPYTGFLPEPSDAGVNILRQLADQLDPEGSPPEGLTISVTSLEAPSVLLAFQMHFRALGHDLTPQVQVSDVQSPDPRRASGPVEYLLWEYDDVTPRPAVDPPRAEVATVVARLAAREYDLAAWGEEAKRLGKELGFAAVSDLLGTMVHPPPMPEGMPSWVWLPRVQLAAALILSHVDEGWQGSIRRKVLSSLLRGPMDWSVDATIVALTELAQTSREIEADVTIAFLDAVSRIPRPGHCCYEYALACNAMRLPNLPDEARQAFGTMRRILEEEGEPPAGPPGRTQPSLTPLTRLLLATGLLVALLLVLWLLAR